MKVKSESEAAQLCPTLSDPMDCSLPGSPVHGVFQAKVLEWGAINRQNKSMVLEGGVMADYERWSLTQLDGCEGIFSGDVKLLYLNCCSILKLLLIIYIDTYIHQNSLKICEFHCR